MEQCTNEFCNVCNSTEMQNKYFSKYQSPNIVIVPSMPFENGPPLKKSKLDLDKITSVENSQSTLQEQETISTLTKVTELNSGTDCNIKIEPNELPCPMQQMETTSLTAASSLTKMDKEYTSDEICIKDETLESQSVSSTEKSTEKRAIDKIINTLLLNILPFKKENQCNKVTQNKDNEDKNDTVTHESTECFENVITKNHKNYKNNNPNNEKPCSTFDRKVKNKSSNILNSRRKSPCQQCKQRENKVVKKVIRKVYCRKPSPEPYKKKILKESILKPQKHNKCDTIKINDSIKVSEISTNNKQLTTESKTITASSLKSVVQVTKNYNFNAPHLKFRNKVHSEDDLRKKLSKIRVRNKRDSLNNTIPNSKTKKLTRSNISQKEPQQNIKTIKLVINLICQKQKDSANNSKEESNSETHQQTNEDLSFLDDFNVDDIVECLNDNKSNMEIPDIHNIGDCDNNSKTEVKYLLNIQNSNKPDEETKKDFEIDRSQSQEAKQYDDNNAIKNTNKKNVCNINQVIKQECEKAVFDVYEKSTTMSLKEKSDYSSNHHLNLDNVIENALLNPNEADTTDQIIIKKEIIEYETESEGQNFNNSVTNNDINSDMILSDSKIENVSKKLSATNCDSNVLFSEESKTSIETITSVIDNSLTKFKESDNSKLIDMCSDLTNKLINNCIELESKKITDTKIDIDKTTIIDGKSGVIGDIVPTKSNNSNGTVELNVKNDTQSLKSSHLFNLDIDENSNINNKGIVKTEDNLSGKKGSLQSNQIKSIAAKKHQPVVETKSVDETSINSNKAKGELAKISIETKPKLKSFSTMDQSSELDNINLIKGKPEPLFYVQLKKSLKMRMFNYLHAKYEIGALINNGKYSFIFNCKDPKGVEFAIKVLRKGHDRYVSGVKKEKMLVAVQNEIPKENFNCVFLINAFGIIGHWCFLMEYYPNNLRQVLKERKKSFHIDEVQRLSRQLVSAITILRNNNIVHSDIKPGHILLNNSLDQLKLCGFDEMRYQDDNFHVIPNIGTASYRAPEVILGISAGFSLDVWSTALVMYEMATSYPLFPGTFNNHILYKQILMLGALPQDMIDGSPFKDYHFCGKYFMKRSGFQGKNLTFISKFNKCNLLAASVYEAYNKEWAKLKSKREKRQDEQKIELFLHLLEQMLALHPNQRLPIEFVFADAFIFEMFN